MIQQNKKWFYAAIIGSLTLTAFLSAIVYVTTSTPKCTVVDDAFYVPQKDLAKAGITFAALDLKRVHQMQDMIRDYYAGEYTESLKKQLASTPDALKRLMVGPPSFSQPREYRGLDGTVGMLADALVYAPSIIDGHQPYLFLFHINGVDLQMEKIIPMVNPRKEEVMEIDRIRTRNP